MKSVYDYLPKINANTAEEMAEQAGLDFTALKVDLHYNVMDETPREELLATGITLNYPVGKTKEVRVPDKVAVIREDDGRYLGTVGRNRGILQYRDVLAFTEALVSQGNAAYVTGGIIGSGEQAFVVMKTKDSFKLSGTDAIDCYFYITTSHDNSKGLEIVPAPLRSANGTVLTVGREYRIGFRHSSKVQDRVKRASLSINKVEAYFNEMDTSFRLLRSVNLTSSQFDIFVKSLFPDSDDRPKRSENVRDEITTIYKTGPACQLPSTKGTMLGAYFAVVEWVDKIRNVKHSKVRPNEYDAKLFSLLEGSGARHKADAYAFAIDMVRQLKDVSLSGSGIYGDPQ